MPAFRGTDSFACVNRDRQVCKDTASSCRDRPRFGICAIGSPMRVLKFINRFPPRVGAVREKREPEVVAASIFGLIPSAIDPLPSQSTIQERSDGPVRNNSHGTRCLLDSKQALDGFHDPAIGFQPRPWPSVPYSNRQPSGRRPKTAGGISSFVFARNRTGAIESPARPG
jgi:hypothetical protein